MVYAGALSQETRWALEKYSDSNDFTEWLGDRMWVQSQWFAWLVALLKEEQDTAELFPKGKWATIQRMQDLLADSAKRAIAQRVSEGSSGASKEGDAK